MDKEHSLIAANASGSGMQEANMPEVKHKFYEHICGNISEQNTFAVLSIIELLAHNIKPAHPRLKEVVVRTDNADNYHNRVLPVVCSFIFKQYGIKVKALVHNETQDRNWSADLHFAVAIRFVDKYIES